MSLESLVIARTQAIPLAPDDLDRDPRGIVWMYEEPNPRATYVLGCDPTVGLTGWDRRLRTQDDSKTDNAAVEVIRVGKPDVQVAEYAAPVDAFELAPVLNYLGRLYGAHHEEGQALLIIEVYPGPGLITQRELISRYGYTNLYQQRYLDTLVPQLRRASPFGWTATRQSVRDLWVKGMHHLTSRSVVLHSLWLVEEMSDCEPDERTMALKAIFGRHDDRVRAMLLALWAAHDWDVVFDPSDAQGPELVAQPDWQKSDISLDALAEAWDDRVSALLEEER